MQKKYENYPWLKRKIAKARNKFRKKVVVLVREGDVFSSKQLEDISLDKAKEVKVEFDRAVKNVEFINCEGRVVDEKTAVIEKIDAFEFAGISADYK